MSYKDALLSTTLQTSGYKKELEFLVQKFKMDVSALEEKYNLEKTGPTCLCCGAYPGSCDYDDIDNFSWYFDGKQELKREFDGKTLELKEKYKKAHKTL